jgi:hypothetical protein
MGRVPDEINKMDDAVGIHANLRLHAMLRNPPDLDRVGRQGSGEQAADQY